MEQYFRRIFDRVLSKIESEDIREKTVECFVIAAKEGGWQKPEDIEKIPFTLLTETKGINFIEHTMAVTEGAVGLAEAIKANYRKMPYTLNMDFLLAGGLLHDVGKLKEIEYADGVYRKSYNGKCTRHPISGAILADRVGLPQEIVNIVANHAKEGDGRPQRIETVLIHQADFATFDPMVMMTKGLLIGE